MHARLALTAALGSLALVACAEPVTAPAEEFEPAFAPGGRPFAPFTPGQQQALVDTTRGFTYAIHPEGIGQVLAQTFTPAANEWLGHVELPVGCAAGVALKIRIRDGLAGPILSEFDYDGLPEVVDGEFELFQVYDAATSSGIFIRKDRTYAIELSAVPQTGPNTTCGLAPGPAGNTYAGGKGWYQDPINGPDFIPIPTGDPADDEDLPFITLVR